MDIKTEGIVLRATDYKENDKLLTLFTPSLGKITAGIRGVKKAKAKLNFAAQPFAFCEYILAERGGRYTVTPLLAQHSVTEQALLYLVEKGEISYLHLTDTGRLPQATLEYLKGRFFDKQKKLNFITFDCTFLFYEAGAISRHMGLEDNKAMLSWLKENGVADDKTRCAITHFSHNNNPLRETTERATAEYGYFAAYDGAILIVD